MKSAIWKKPGDSTMYQVKKKHEYIHVAGLIFFVLALFVLAFLSIRNYIPNYSFLILLPFWIVVFLVTDPRRKEWRCPDCECPFPYGSQPRGVSRLYLEEVEEYRRRGIKGVYLPFRSGVFPCECILCGREIYEEQYAKELKSPLPQSIRLLLAVLIYLVAVSCFFAVALYGTF